MAKQNGREREREKELTIHVTRFVCMTHGPLTKISLLLLHRHLSLFLFFFLYRHLSISLSLFLFFFLYRHLSISLSLFLFFFLYSHLLIVAVCFGNFWKATRIGLIKLFCCYFFVSEQKVEIYFFFKLKNAVASRWLWTILLLSIDDTIWTSRYYLVQILIDIDDEWYRFKCPLV